MAKLVVKIPHFKSGMEKGGHLAHYVRYMATRPGVVKLGEVRGQQPATPGQTQLIQQLLLDFPDAQELLEYQDYQKSPTIANASAFIFSAMEYNFDMVGRRENYLDYIAHRPNVVLEGNHGLFTAVGEKVVVSQVAARVASHPGVVWTPIISLRREDADRLGYNQLESWRELLRASAGQLAEAFKIDPDNLQWYAALHDEGHHPHIHMVCYAKDAKQGFVTVQGIEAAKSLLARQIFRDDNISIYQQQTQARDALSVQTEARMAELCKSLQGAASTDPDLVEMITTLHHQLQAVKGKKVYGYLPSSIKQQVDSIVDTLAQQPGLAEIYTCWWQLRLEVLGTYHNTVDMEKPPLSQQQELKRIRNIVVQEVLRMDELCLELPATEVDENADPENLQDMAAEEDNIRELPSGDDEAPLDSEAPSSVAVEFHVQWTPQYKAARRSLYGDADTPPNFLLAYQKLLAEAALGNALAMHDLGRMFADGLGLEISPQLSNEWYGKALLAYHTVERREPGSYLQYRIGKMYARGQGTDKD